MTIKFRDPLSAKACIIMSYFFHRCLPTSTSLSLTSRLHNARRFFAGLRVEACLYTGQQLLKCSKGEDDDVIGDGIGSERKRFDDFAQWLMDEDEA